MHNLTRLGRCVFARHHVGRVSGYCTVSLLHTVSLCVLQAAMWRERAEAATAELRQAATAAGTGAGAGGPGDTEALARHASEANAAAAASANDAARARQQVSARHTLTTSISVHRLDQRCTNLLGKRVFPVGMACRMLPMHVSSVVGPVCSSTRTACAQTIMPRVSNSSVHVPYVRSRDSACACLGLQIVTPEI